MQFVHLADCKIKMRLVTTGIRYKIKVMKFVERDYPLGRKLYIYRVRVFEAESGEPKHLTVTEQATDTDESVILDTTSPAIVANVFMLAETAIDKRIAEIIKQSKKG